MENTGLMNREETQLTDEQLDRLLEQEVQTSLDNIDPRPPRVKMLKESLSFISPDGSTQKDITGILVFHHKARGRWETEGQKIPTCSSLDGTVGVDEDGNEHACKSCQFNIFGTGKDGYGKACKEMRWIYMLQGGEAIPSRISLPPTSLTKFDAFISALAQKRIAPIQKIVKLSLETGENRGFKYPVLAQPEVVGDVPRESILGLIQMREGVVAAARKAGIDAEDYYDGDAADGVGGEEDQPY
jgi:hypothetical protein